MKLIKGRRISWHLIRQRKEELIEQFNRFTDCNQELEDENNVCWIIFKSFQAGAWTGH